MAKRVMVVAALVALLFATMVVPAMAADRDGDADSNMATLYTEDNDSDGVGNNIADEENAHPSGKDRSVENTRSGNQGRSESKPDQNLRGKERDYEGTDKPNGAGGVDKLDQDGNNGCGNDDDFEDDNEGHCGRKLSSEGSSTEESGTIVVQGTVVSKETSDPKGVSVLGVQYYRVSGEAQPVRVLGVTYARGSSLPQTGGEATPILLAGVALLIVGATLSKLATRAAAGQK